MITKAVIPAAGFGTRFLPITKSLPKEMLPVVDTPVIQYVVEEAVLSGITDILIVISSGKHAIEEHFDRSLILEAALEAKGKFEELEQIKQISKMAHIHYVFQPEMNGLGDAILYAKQHVGKEPFAVFLGDTIVAGKDKPVTKQLIEVYDRYHGSVVALEQVPAEKVSRYGVIDGELVSEMEKTSTGNILQSSGFGRVFKARDFVEKPSPAEAPSDLAIASRYLFTPEIFDILEKTPRGKNNEVQLTDAMRQLVKIQAMYGLQIDGTRYDIGNKLDFIKTNLVFGLQNETIGPALRDWLNQLMNSII
jgi:UTP--glucose-1-phosphate uridylyltransferase